LECKHKSKERYDKSVVPLNLAEEDRVLIQDKAREGKLTPKWLGPYPIVDIQSDVKIPKKNKHVKVNRNPLKQSHERT